MWAELSGCSSSLHHVVSAGIHQDPLTWMGPRLSAGRSWVSFMWPLSPQSLLLQSLLLHVASLLQKSLDFFTWWLGEKRERVETTGLLSSGTHLSHIQLTKASVEPSPDSRGEEKDTTSWRKMLKGAAAMISNPPNMTTAFSGLLYHPWPRSPCKNLLALEPAALFHRTGRRPDCALEGADSRLPKSCSLNNHP